MFWVSKCDEKGLQQKQVGKWLKERGVENHRRCRRCEGSVAVDLGCVCIEKCQQQITVIRAIIIMWRKRVQRVQLDQQSIGFDMISIKYHFFNILRKYSIIFS